MKTFIIAALTADGFIAENNDQPSTAWTSQADKKFFIERTKQAGVMVMGQTTYDTIGRPLSGRLNIVYSFKAAELNASNKFDPKELRFTDLPPAQLLDELEQDGYQELAICGGASIYTLFLKAGLVDTLYLTVEPRLFGQGVSLFNTKISADLKLVDVKKLDEQIILLEYTLTTKE